MAEKIMNAKYSWNGREVNFEEFVMLQIETGSKTKWFNCPAAWENNRKKIESMFNKKIEELQKESWDMLKKGKHDKALVMAINSFQCTFCSYGHMTECHYPHDCDSEFCDHYISEEEEY